MDMAMASDLMQQAVGIAIRLCAPLLLLSMVVGVVVAIFQAVTQVHEQTIGFTLKLLTVVSVLLIGGGWMLENLQDFFRSVALLISG